MNRLGQAARLAEALMERFGRLLTAAAALSVGGIVIILVFSSMQRYILASPIPETEELAAFLFVALAFFSITEGFMSDRQIRIALVWRKLPQAMQGWMMILGHVLTIVVVGILIQQLFDFAWQSYQFNSRSYVADIIEWPWMMIMPFSLFVMCLGVVARILVDLDRVDRKSVV